MTFAEQGLEKDEDPPLTVIPDANVLIHGTSLSDLPWAELGRSTIEVLFVPPMIRELDKLKNQTGRPNKVARQLSSDIRALINAVGRQAQIRESGPAVSKRVELGSVTEVLNAALRLDHADQALINYALYLKQNGADVLLLTDDTICGTTAQGVGLATHFLPDHWLREPEADENGKENARLKAEIQRLRTAEPQVELCFRDLENKPLTRFQTTVTRWPALSEAELEELMADVRRRCPQAASFERRQPRATDPLGGAFAAIERLSQMSRFDLGYEPATEEEIERYKAHDYPNWLNSVRKMLESLHLTLEERRNWPMIVAVARNEGTRPATEALLRIRARGALSILNKESNDEEGDDDEESNGKAPDRLELPLPPAPPRGRVKTIGDVFGAYGVGLGLGADLFGASRPLRLSMLAPPKRRESDVFYWRTGKQDWVEVMELECASWRHGQDEITFSLKVRPNNTDDTSGVIELSVHAHNISDPLLERLPIRIAFEDGSTIDEARALVDMLGRSARAQGRL